jgi:hypothetical protein
MKSSQQVIGMGLLVLLSLAGPLGAAAVTGTVVERGSETPLAGAAIEVVLSGKQRRVLQPTDKDGRFHFALNSLFSSEDLDTEILYLRFSKAGYSPHVVSRRSRTRGVFEISNIRIALEPVRGDGPAPAAAANGVKRIFHAPYDLYAESSGSRRVLDQLNERFPRHLRRGIVTHLQGLRLPADVAIEALPEVLRDQDPVAVRRFARRQDALAVVQGEAELIDEDGRQFVELASEYRIVPDLPDFKPGTLHVDDKIPPEEIRPSRLSKSLSKIWGGSTVFAMALREVQQAIQESDPAKRRERLERAEHFLKAQQRELPRDDILKIQIEELADVIEQVRQP